MTESAGKLILCPTPLGNLGDITLRTLDALREAKVVYAEDTRVTGKLLAAYDIHKRLERLDENLMATQTDQVIDRVLSGETVAFCSDAGMPGISDPGARLVAAARLAGATVEVLPGPTATATAYVASGFTVPQFYFGGFLPRKEAERRQCLKELGPLRAALIFYESPKRIASSLATIAEVFPYREVAVCRELTKLHEEVFRGMADQVREEFEVRTEQGTVKGEIVIVIDTASEAEKVDRDQTSQKAAAERALEMKQQGGMTHKDIVKALQQEFGVSRNDAYRIAHESQEAIDGSA